MTPLLIGVSGRLGSGKDTAFGFIQEWAERRGLVATRRAFADQLKISAARALGIVGTNDELVAIMNKLKAQGRVKAWWDDEPGRERFTSVSGREYLQLYGTEAHREVFGDSFWTDALLPLGGGDRGENVKWPYRFATSDELPNGKTKYHFPDIAVVTDVRFDNEAQRITDLGGILVVVHRPEAEAAEAKHASEQGISRWNYLINNDGTLDDFRERTERVIDRAWDYHTGKRA